MNSSLTGPFSKDTFTQKPWRILKNKLTTLKSGSRQSDLLPECQQLLSLLKDLNDCSSLEEYFGDSSIKKFFLSELIPANARNILRCKVLERPEMEDMLNECLKHVILVWIKTLPEDDLALRKTVEQILNPNIPYYHREPPSQPSQANTLNNDVNGGDFVGNTKPALGASFARFIESLRENQRMNPIYEIISNKESLTSSLKMMSLTCFIVNHLNPFFPADSVIESMSQVKQAFWNILLLHGELYIDSFKDNLRDMLRAYNLLLRRQSYSLQDKQREMDLLKLQISVIYVKSPIRERKFVGLGLVNRIIKELENPGLAQLKLKSQPGCNEALQGVFYEVYRFRAPWRGLWKESIMLFEYMVRHKLLNSVDSKALKSALNLVGRDQFAKQLIVDFLKKAKEYDQLDLFVNCLISENLAKIQAVEKSDIYILYRIYKVSSRGVYGKVINFLREILAKSEIVTDFAAVEFAFFRHKKMMWRNGEGNSVFDLFRDSADEVKEDVTKFSSFRIMHLFLLDINRRRDFEERTGIREILAEKEILKLFVDHIKHFKTSRQQEDIFTKKGKRDYIRQISMRIDFLKELFKFASNLTFTILNQLWESLVSQAVIPVEKALSFRMLGEFMEGSSSMNPGFIQRFWREKIMIKETKEDLQASKEGAFFFKTMFLLVNQSLEKIQSRQKYSAIKYYGFYLKVQPEELEGFDQLWEFIMSSKDRDTTQEFLSLVESINSTLKDQPDVNQIHIQEKEMARYFTYLGEPQNESKDKYVKCLKLISTMMDDSERRGIGNMITHSKLLKCEEIKVHVQLLGQYGAKKGQADLTISSNSTVFETMIEVAKRFGIGWDEIFLSKAKSSFDLKERLNQHGKTLSELGMKRYENLMAFTREISKVTLITAEDTLHPRVSKVFSDIFEQFSESGKMSPENLASFIDACTGQCPNPNQGARTGDIFSTFDTDRDGYLTVDDFLQFYYQAAKKKPEPVWENLSKFKKLRNDLKNVEDVNNQRADEHSLVSYMISSNKAQFDLLLSLLDQEEAIALEAWTLLNRLPTNHQVFEDLVLMKGVRGVADPEKRDSNAILNMNSKYRLLYTLNIVEYLIHLNQDEVSTISLSDNPEILEKQRTWITDFIEYGGLDHLCSVFSVFSPSESTVLTAPYKRVLAFVKALTSKLKFMGSGSLENEDNRKSQIMKFMELSTKYKCNYKAMEQNVAANLMRKSLRNLKNRRKTKPIEKIKNVAFWDPRLFALRPKYI